LALKGRITLDTKLVVTVGDLAYLSNTWSLSGTGPDGNPVTLGATTAEVARRQGRRHLALCDRQRLGRTGGRWIATDGRLPYRSIQWFALGASSGQSAGI
jgi:hypothetical protein